MSYTKKHHLDHLMLVGSVDDKGTLKLTKEEIAWFLSNPPRFSRKKFLDTMDSNMQSMNPKKAADTWKNFKNNTHLHNNDDAKSLDISVNKSATLYVKWMKLLDDVKKRDDNDALSRLVYTDSDGVIRNPLADYNGLLLTELQIRRMRFLRTSNQMVHDMVINAAKRRGGPSCGTAVFDELLKKGIDTAHLLQQLR